MNKTLFRGLFALSATATNGAIAHAAAKLPAKPNIVFFISDDHSLRDSTVYGATDVQTPNMQRISEAGLTFNRAFAASPTCAPSRGAMLSGLMPARNGAEPNQTSPNPDIKLMPAYLHEQGYEVVAFGKVGHYNFTKRYGFDVVEHTGYHDDEAIPAAIEWLKNRKSTKPLAFFVGTNWPHVPWPETGEGFDAAKVKLPPTLLDTPQTRQWRTRYYAAIKRFDTELGEVYDASRAKFGSNMFFLHSSDQGAQWPFSKWNLYDEGIRVPMIATWPGVIKPGERTDSMVDWVDILPTLIQIAGGNPPPSLDGRSMLPILLDPKQKGRDMIFATHSGDGDINVYPMRCVRTDRWKYILNLHPEFAFRTHIDLKADTQTDPYWPTWIEAAKTDPLAAALVHRYRERPAEELYDILADPNELHNLAAQPQYAKVKSDLHKDLESWMAAEGDKGTVYGKSHLLTDPDPVESPKIAGKSLTISVDVTPDAKDGVILAQGGNQLGYALYLVGGKPVFGVRENRTLTTATATEAPTGKFSIEAKLEKTGAMTLAINGAIVARAQAAGPIAKQPAEELSIGQDTQFAVGDYTAPHPLAGKIENVKVVAQ